MAKSLLRSPTKLCVERAINGHDCQANSGHRIRGGDKRLKVFTDPRSPDHYCADCARKIIKGDLAKLAALLGEIES